MPFAPLTLDRVLFERFGAKTRARLPSLSGRFVSTDQTDLLALAFFPEREPAARSMSGRCPPSPSRAAAPVRLPGALDPRLTPLSFSLGDSGAYAADVATTSADLDGDGRDEAIFAMPADGGIHCGLFLIGAMPSGSFGSAAREPVIIDEPCPDPQIAAVNMHEPPTQVKGLVQISRCLTGQTNASDRHLYVLWNDGNGQFSAENRSSSRRPRSLRRRSRSCLRLTARTGLAYVTKNSLRLLPPPNAGMSWQLAHLSRCHTEQRHRHRCRRRER